MGVERCVIGAHLTAHLAFLPSLAHRRKLPKPPGFHGEFVGVRVRFVVAGVSDSESIFPKRKTE